MNNEQTTEEWRPIPGWEGLYEVSNLGRARSVRRTIVASNGVPRRLPGCQLKPSINRDGHHLIRLSRPGVTNSHPYVHRLVLLAFAGPCPSGMEACHDDGDPANNSIGNLYWGTRSDNINDRFRHGWLPPGRTATHCPQGHISSPANIVTTRRGHRRCRECRVEQNREYRQRRAARELLAAPGIGASMGVQA